MDIAVSDSIPEEISVSYIVIACSRSLDRDVKLCVCADFPEDAACRDTFHLSALLIVDARRENQPLLVLKHEK